MNQQELKKINELMRLNRDEFWKEIKRKRKPSIPVNASTKQLVEKYTDLFNKNNESTFADFSDSDIKQHVEYKTRDCGKKKSRKS